MDHEKKRLVICEPDGFSRKALADLEDCFEVVCGPNARRDLLLAIVDAYAIFVRLGHTIDPEFFDAAPSLRYLVTPTTGLNHIDLAMATKRQVEVLSLRGETALLSTIFSTAELTWGLLLNLSRKISSAHTHVVTGHWNRDNYRGTDLAGRTMGIVGYGRIGKMVGSYADTFGMKVVYYDPLIPNPPNRKSLSLDELCAQSDIISVHVNADPENRDLLGSSQFAMMSPSTFFLNTSRGEIVDECALLAALQTGRIAGAALDVLRSENDPEYTFSRRLITYAAQNENLILTPHIGGATSTSMHRTEEYMTKKLIERLGQ